MVLGYGGFLGLSSKDYRAELKDRTDQQLQEQEIIKLRRQFLYGALMGGGLSAAPVTLGGSLITVGISGRKYRVADRKLDLIREELKSRGIAPHKLEIKDVAIPVTAGVASLGVGAGLDIGLSELAHIGNVVGAGPIGITSSLEVTPLDSISAGAANASNAVEGFADGFLNQGTVIAQGGITIRDALESTADPSAIAQPAQSILFDQAQLHEMIASASGEQLGQAAALHLQSVTGQVVAMQCTFWACESLENPDHFRRAVNHLGCSRLYGLQHSDYLCCAACGGSIKSGQYMRQYHPSFCQSAQGLHQFAVDNLTEVHFSDCCQCRSDEYDLCLPCFDGGTRCNCGPSKLRCLQLALNINAKVERCRSAAKIRRQQNFPYLRCDVCRHDVKQGRYYGKASYLGR